MVYFNPMRKFIKTNIKSDNSFMDFFPVTKAEEPSAYIERNYKKRCRSLT